ncbi:MAG: alpha/beta hydrolase [Clostridiales bacterium]|nr:alpha/beta hydrolase [Clostridiales bacterium]
MIIVLMLLVALMYSGYYFTKVSLTPTNTPYEETFRIEVQKGLIDEIKFNSMNKEEVYIKSDYGYNLSGYWFGNNNSIKTMIICHGYTYSLYGSVKYMDMFLKRGYNILIYNHRYHGKSGGDNCSLGYYEKMDLKSCVDWVKLRVGEDSIVGTHGESMGAATALMHAAIDDRISFVIADCPFESVYEQFKHRLKIEYKLPAIPFLNFSNLFTKLKINTFYKDISPIRVIDKIKQPVLFIHGDQDQYIPPSHSKHLFALKEGHKTLYLSKGADHAEAFEKDRVLYVKTVYDFLDSIG